jgi:hypothetical protein
MKRKTLRVKRKTVTTVKAKQLKTVTGGGHGGWGGGGGGGDGGHQQGQDQSTSRYCPRW